MALEVSPVPLVAGLLGIPIVGNALGRTFITPKAEITSQAEANAELRRMVRNFALFNGLLAVGLGYATAKTDNTGWRSAALGGSIGAGLIATMLGAALVVGPEPAQEQPPAQLLPAGGGARIPQGWYSNLIGVPR